MPKPTKRIAATLSALAVPAALAVGCGGVPGNAVATVDGDSITKKTFDHWIDVAAKSSGQPGASVPDAPEFTKCIATKKKAQPKPAKGQPKVTDKQLKEQCKTEYEGLRDQVLQLLISFEWIQGEAEELGVKVSDKEVQKQYDQSVKQSFPKKEEFAKFLKDSGQSEEDIKLRVKLDALSTKIREKIIKGKDQVSDKEIADYYAKNKARFAQPERRDLRVVLTKTEAKANEAKRELEGGADFKSVAKEYSIDQASKSTGGVLPAVAKGQQEKAFDDAIFEAEKGKLVGPVKTQFGYYVFEVTKVTKASQQTQAEAKETIKQLLVSEKQSKALDKFVKDFRDKWKDKTDCREGYVTQDCKNAKEPDTTSTPGGAAGGAPQQVPQQGAPQQAPPQGAPQQAPQEVPAG